MYSDGRNRLTPATMICLQTTVVTDQKSGRQETIMEEEEIKKTMNSMATGKAASPDGTVVEMLEALEDFGIKRITWLANQMYAEGHFAAKMCKSTCIISLFPKKPGRGLQLNASYTGLSA